MGTIHLAVAGGLADFHKLLVVKELRQDLSANQRFIEMFLDEAKLAARLNHPNVVQTLEAGREGDRYFLSMEFLDGQPFSAIWNGAGRFPQVPLPMRLKILCDALTGLHYAHTLTEYDGTPLDIVHRDVSPQNIFVTYGGQVKVVDFGIAKAAVSSTLTAPGMFKGKFGYAAPEQVRGDAVDARTDVFAMGVILWETLTMRNFSSGVVERSAVAARLAGNEPRASQFRPLVDERLAAICDRALEVDPDARFESAEELRCALDEFLVQSGQRIEPAAIQQVLDHKFAAERRAIQGIIEHHFKYGAVEESHVKRVAFGTEAGNNQPTQVADLSKYVRETHETAVSGVEQAPRIASRSRTIRILAATTLAGAAAIGLAFNALRPAAKLETSAQAAPSAAIVAAPVAAVAPLVAAPPPAAIEAQVTAPVAAALDEPAHAIEPSLPEAAGQVVQTATLEPEVQSPQSALDTTLHAGWRPASSKTARTRAAAMIAPQLDAQQAARTPTAAATAQAEPVAPAAPAKPGVGADLNRLGRSDQRRAIDTEL
jgi:hypothetical protein